MTSLQIFLNIILFLLSSLVTGLRFMSISSLVLELWQFPFIRVWPDIRKLKVSRSEFCPISEDWGESGIPNLARVSLMKCYWTLQDARVTAFTVFELLMENQHGEGGGNHPPPPRLGLNRSSKFWGYLGQFPPPNRKNKNLHILL